MPDALSAVVTLAPVWVYLQPGHVDVQGERTVTPIAGMDLPTGLMTALMYGCAAVTTVLVLIGFRRS